MQTFQRLFLCQVASLLLLLTIVTTVACAQAGHKNVSQPALGYRTVKILSVDGLQFKDLNRNGRLDQYEDWRLSYEQRARDLLSKMTIEEKAGFMLISSTALKNESSFGGQGSNNAPVTSDFNEEDRVSTTNVFTRKPLPYPIINIAGTTKGVTQFHLRHFILRANTSARIIAVWANKLQSLCESDALGIPAIIASNPRNNMAKDASVGLSVGKTVFSTWPGELGLSAMHDLSLVREFATIARQEWKAVGLRKGYMYMADLSTEPRWQRTEGTFGENADWVAQIMTQIVLGFQGNKLDSNAVALTTKHFPGGGAGKGGQDPHFDWGKIEHFPGGQFNNNLIPFKAAIKAGTSAIMPYYSMPHDTPFDTIAYAYNKAVIHDLLRTQLGFDGIINSDTGPIEMMPWGAENLSITERYKKTLEAGVNLYSGTADPAKLLETIKTGIVDTALVNASVFRLLMEKFKLGLFENPYVDEDAAEKIVGSQPFQQRANIAMRKSIVLLRNNDNALPLKPKTKIYFESYYQKRGTAPGHVFSSDSGHVYPVEFVTTPEAADVILLWLTPGSKSLFESDGSPIYLSLSKNGIDTGYVNSLSAKKPTVLVINFTNPWVIDEIYNPATRARFKGMLATFNTTPDALLDVITGKFNPSGKMPFTTPVSEEAVQQQLSDVPGYMKGADYPLFKYGEGLRYK